MSTPPEYRHLVGKPCRWHRISDRRVMRGYLMGVVGETPIAIIRVDPSSLAFPGQEPIQWVSFHRVTFPED